MFTRACNRAAGLTLAVSFAVLSGCASAKKKPLALEDLLGKKVALVGIEGETTSRKVVEVALINQLVQKGSFDLVSKQDVDAARTSVEQDTTDWQGVARRAGAEVALRAQVIEFEAKENAGYSSEEIDDSLMAAERGEKERKVKHPFKVKSIDGKVRVRLQFVPLAADAGRAPLSAVAEHEEQVTSGSRTEAPHLPPKLRFLERLANEAFRKFFEKY